MISLPGSNKIYIVFAFQVLLLIWLVHVTYRSDSAPSTSWNLQDKAASAAHAVTGKLGHPSKLDALKAAGNSSLGFGEILYISMPQ